MEVDRFTVTSEYEPPFWGRHVHFHGLEVMGVEARGVLEA